MDWSGLFLQRGFSSMNEKIVQIYSLQQSSDYWKMYLWTFCLWTFLFMKKFCPLSAMEKFFERGFPHILQEIRYVIVPLKKSCEEKH